MDTIVKTPTGHIIVTDGTYGKLECLSLGDYGADKNLKADFLGHTKEIHGVAHTKLLPLERKWVITISTQYGCGIGCTFCDVPKVGYGNNMTYEDLEKQVAVAMSMHPEVIYSDRLNLHFARMGEPTFNFAVITFTNDIINKYPNFKIHPVVSTMCPKTNQYLFDFLKGWMNIKNKIYDGNAGLQLSINSTDEKERAIMFNKKAMSLDVISSMFKDFEVRGRKITLNFALADYTIDAKVLRSLFDPERFLCKITPMHNTASCDTNNIKTIDGYESYYPYKKVEEDLKNEGFDVIVFIPSHEEDISKITCGNAILADMNI